MAQPFSLSDLAVYDANDYIRNADAGKRERTLADLGQYAAKGDFKGAQATAFAGGETELGLHLKGMNDEDQRRLVGDAASWAYGADTPDKWEQGRQTWAAKGYDIGPFQSRQALLSQAMTIQDRMAQANADRSYNLQVRQEDRLAAGSTASPTDDIREYEYAKQNGFTGSFQDWLARPGVGGNAGPKMSLTPTWLRGPNNEWVPGQLTQGGNLELSNVPEGYSAVPPGDVSGARTAGTVDAKTAAAARAALPGAEQAVAIATDVIQRLRTDTKGQEEQFGSVLGYPQRGAFGLPGLPVMPGSARGNFLVNLEQAGGQAFMQARQMLKGGGQITDFEGKRGEAAYSRMQAAAERGDMGAFNSALDDFEEAVLAGYQKLQDTAGGGYSQGGPGLAQPGGDDLDSLLNQYAP